MGLDDVLGSEGDHGLQVLRTHDRTQTAPRRLPDDRAHMGDAGDPGQTLAGRTDHRDAGLVRRLPLEPLGRLDGILAHDGTGVPDLYAAVMNP